MSARTFFLFCLICMAGMPAPAVSSDDYMGGGIQLGGSGTAITMGTTTVAPDTPGTLPPMVPAAVGALLVTTTPAGASISVDGVPRGISPATVSGLSPGSHTVLLHLDGYQDVSVPITIITGQTQTYTTGLQTAPTPLPALPAATRSPGFTLILGIAALGAVILVNKASR